MKYSKAIGLAIVGALLVGALIFWLVRSNETTEPVAKDSAATSVEVKKSEPEKPYTAKFAIYSNGFYRAFSLPMYHNLSKKAYITAPDTHVVRVDKPGITWDQFFKTLPFELSYECLVAGTGEQFCNNDTNSLKFYINGTRTTDILSKKIQKDDELLVSYGQESPEQIQQQIDSVSNPSN